MNFPQDIFSHILSYTAPLPKCECCNIYVATDECKYFKCEKILCYDCLTSNEICMDCYNDGVGKCRSCCSDFTSVCCNECQEMLCEDCANIDANLCSGCVEQANDEMTTMLNVGSLLVL